MRTDKELREILERTGWIDPDRPELDEEETDAILNELTVAEMWRLVTLVAKEHQRRAAHFMAALKPMSPEWRAAEAKRLRGQAKLDQLKAELRDLLEGDRPGEDGY
jgi:hypothetical protein